MKKNIQLISTVAIGIIILVAVISIPQNKTDENNIQHIQLFFKFLLSHNKDTYKSSMNNAMYLIEEKEGKRMRDLYKENKIFKFYEENSELETQVIIDSILINRSLFSKRYDVYLRQVIVNNNTPKSIVQYIASVKLKDTGKIETRSPFGKIITEIKYRQIKPKN